jgi:hypothetical protein
VKSERTFWVAPQLDVGSITKLSEGSNSGTITIRIPTANELPATIPRLVEAVARVEKLLATRVVVSSPVPDFISSIKSRIPREEVIQGFKDKTDTLRIEQAQEMLRNKRGDDALGQVEGIISDTLSSVAIKFSALLMKERIRTVGLARSQVPQPEVPRFRLAATEELQRLVKKGLPHLKFHALIAKRAAELDCLISKDWSLFLSWRLHERKGDLLWGATLDFHRSTLVRKIALKYNQCVRLAQYAANSKHRWALPEALPRIPMAVGVLILRLRLEGFTAAAERYCACALQICKLAAWICGESNDESQLPGVVAATVALTQGAPGEGVDWA